MTATQNPAQDVSDAKAELWRIWAIDGMPKDKQRLAEAAFEIGLMAGIGQSTARELQQCPNCLNDGCHCATCNPYPGELQQAQVVGGKIANGHHCGLPEHLCNHPSHTTPQSSAQDVSDWKLRLRNELRMSAMKTTFTFTRDEVIDLMGETAISIMSARELQQAQGVGEKPSAAWQQAYKEIAATPLSEIKGDLYQAVKKRSEEIEAATPQSSAPVVGRRRDAAIEAAAKAIYEQWANDPNYVAWIDGGNSLKQDEARKIAESALTGRGE